MKNTAAAVCLIVIVAAWLGAQAPASPPQAPLGGQPPVDYALGPDSQPQPGVPAGTLTKHVLAPGKFYPGTPHNYQVFVPAQYDSSRPIPFLIFLDGSGYAGNNVRVPVVLENLIARRELPPMLAMFIDPGVMPALSDQAQNRYERIFEYDSLTPRFANFLIEELIPEVAKTYNLSKDPNDHGIAGLSTGGVGAFVAAWNRPDQFRRVITWIGSFGNFRGADRLPGLIRRTEPRPIRIFMQTGRQDLVNYAGSWYLENPRMAAALEFAGNDVKIDLGEDGHSNRHGASMLPDTLRWLWRGYPQPVTAGEAPPGAGRGLFALLVPRREVVAPPPNPAPPTPPPAAPAAARPTGPRGAVYALISRDKPWEQVGDVFFADPSSNRIYRSDAARTVTVFKENSRDARALRVGADGRLYATQPASRRIVSYGPAGDEKVVGRCTNILNKPEFNATPITSIAFGGAGRSWLYVTQGGRLFRRETKRTGVVAWEPVKPPQPGL